MNDQSIDKVPAKIREQAYHWLADLESGDMTPEQFEAFLAWRDKNPQHAETMQHLQSQWQKTHGMKLEKPESLNPQPLRNGAAGLLSNMKFYWSTLTAQQSLIAASLTFFLLATTVYLTLPPQQPQVYENSYTTARAEQKTINLDDGSILHMNALSKIVVAFSEDERNIYLKRGEVLFDVAHNPLRPFTVYASGNRIQAIGTQFNVDMDNKFDVTVTLVEGVIRVVKHVTNSSNLFRILEKPGQQVRLHRGNIRPGGDDDSLQIIADGSQTLERTLSWREGNLVFKGERLDDALSEINRHSNHSIILKDDTLASTPVYAVFETGDWRGALSAIAHSFPLHVVQISESESHLVPSNTNPENSTQDQH